MVNQLIEESEKIWIEKTWTAKLAKDQDESISIEHNLLLFRIFYILYFIYIFRLVRIKLYYACYNARVTKIRYAANLLHRNKDDKFGDPAS